MRGEFAQRGMRWGSPPGPARRPSAFSIVSTDWEPGTDYPEVKILNVGSRGLLLLLFFFSCAKLLYVSLFHPTGWFAVLTLKERRYLFLKNCWPVSRTRFSLSTDTTIKKDSSTSTCSAGVGARPSATTCDSEQVKHLVTLRGYYAFIQEWVSFQNEVRTAFIRRNRCAPVSLRHLQNDTHAQPPQTTRFAIFISERTLFSLYTIPEWNFIPGR